MRQRAVFDFGEIEFESNVFELPTIVPEKFDTKVSNENLEAIWPF